MSGGANPNPYHVSREAVTQWLRGQTTFQYVAVAAAALALAALIGSYVFEGTPAAGLVALALVLCGLAFRKALLWRVRNRLLVTYFLFGVVPVFLIALALMLAAELLLGLFAAQIVRHELNARVERVHAAAQSLLVAASHGANADLMEGLRQRTPKVAALVTMDGSALRLPADGLFASTPPWIVPGFDGIFQSDGRYYIGANARAGTSEAFAWLPLDDETLASIAPGTVSVSTMLSGDSNTIIAFRPSGSRMFVAERGVQREIVPVGSALPVSAWNVPIAGLLPWTVQTSSGAATVFLPVTSTPTALVAGVVTARMGSVVLSLLVIVGSFLLIVEGVSLFSSIGLTRTITRSVADLHRGTLRVAAGDFSHRIPVRGAHQLSALAASFNGMSAKIVQLIGEVRKKERMEAELKIARDVQLQLFPKSVPRLQTLELAGVCLPGRVVSGDYYDYIPLDGRRTVIVLGDVSGKGMSAALLMASIQAALHAQLKYGAAAIDQAPSTATLLSVIGQQLYENTPTEKYATFFCSVYDDETGRLQYTNAGHLPPILVRDGQATPLEGGGIVLGMMPDVTYDEQEVLLRSGDLLAMFSDGVPEAMDAADQEFGEERLAGLLIAHHAEPLDDIIRVVADAVAGWTHDPESRDDLTIVLLRRL